MSPRPNISFIPKRSLAKESQEYRRPVSLFTLIAVGVMLVAIAVYGGLYFYTKSLQEKIDRKEAQLTALREEFDTELINKAKRLQARIEAANELLQRHVAFSLMFELLEAETIKAAQYTTLSYTKEGGAQVLGLSGKTAGFAQLASLRDALKETNVFSEFSVREMGLDEAGGVKFAFEAEIGEDHFRYARKISESAAGQASSTPGQHGVLPPAAGADPDEKQELEGS